MGISIIAINDNCDLFIVHLSFTFLNTIHFSILVENILNEITISLNFIEMCVTENVKVSIISLVEDDIRH